MKQARTPAFGEERQRFTLRFTCEHCTYFDACTERCTHGYPNAVHRLAYNEDASELVFCKDFELV
ncbi:MAG: hypothetical protein ABW252_02510 [Polyangiales bacterium]